MRLFSKKNRYSSNCVPNHVAIIMDGNGRWAKKRGLSRSAGHVAGAKTFRTITKYCSNVGVNYLTVYAFSTENWKRPKEEVNALMALFKKYLEEALRDFSEENIKIHFLGDISAFSSDLQDLIKRTEQASSKKTGMTLNIAMNYGSRSEILRATKLLAKDARDGLILPEHISEEMISSRLYTTGQPDPDLIIRPSGEYRISNFLLWQSAYSEYVIMNVLWPDFKPKHLELAFKQYYSRNRRFGGI